MYKRERTLILKKEKGKKNEHNRKRSIIVNFRMSKEENEILHNRIKLSGMKKQDYMIRSSLQQKIVVVGNKRIFDEIESELYMIYDEIKQLEKVDNLDLIKIEKLRTIAEIINGFEK